MVVVVLLALILAAVLVPPAVQAQAARRDAFVGSFATAAADGLAPSPTRTRAGQVQRRRRIAGGLLLAMAGTLLAGLLPTFRILLVVHLFLVDSFIAYVALLAHMAARRAKAGAGIGAEQDDISPALEPAEPERPRARRRLLPTPGSLVDLHPSFPLAD